jgi:Ca2+-binding EF-hand superfamily protein
MKIGFVVLCAIMAFSFVGCAHKKGHHGKDKHHKMWKKMDADGDGVVTREEFDKAHGEKFAKMDANSDGKITKEEKMAYKKSKKKKGCCK